MKSHDITTIVNNDVQPEHRNGGLAVIATLAAHGVDTIFGIPGTHNLEFYRHLPTLGIRAITPRHEQGAGYAADGYYLASGKPGVVITTSGPGLTNVITAAATAYAESRPMLILSPGVPTGMERADVGLLHETKDSAAAMGSLVSLSRRAHTAEGAAQAVAEAFQFFASSRPGPVHIEVPLDVLEGPWLGTVSTPLEAARPQPAADTVTAAAQLLREAQRPLIVAGGGARGLSADLTELAETIDAPVVTTANGKGAIPESHRLSVGASVRFPAIQQESKAADVLLVLGSELADSDLWGGTIGTAGVNSWDRASTVPSREPEQHVIRVDIDPDQLHKNLPGEVLVQADAGAFIAALQETLNQHAAEVPAGTAAAGASGAEKDAQAAAGEDSAGTRRAASLRAAWQEEFDVQIGSWVTDAIVEAAGAEVIIAGDSSQVTYDGSVHRLVANSDHQLLYMPGFATLGYGIPAAIGAKLARPQAPVAILVGDGAAMFSIQEIMTAVELGLPIPLVVVDNGGYAEIEYQMEERNIDPFAVRLARPDFAALGQAFGAGGITVSGAEDETGESVRERVKDAVAQALGAQGPTVIHVTL